MPDDINSENGLPPKLNLRKIGAVPAAAPEVIAPTATPLPAAASVPTSSGAPAAAHPSPTRTIRITLPDPEVPPAQVQKPDTASPAEPANGPAGSMPKPLAPAATVTPLSLPRPGTPLPRPLTAATPKPLRALKPGDGSSPLAANPAAPAPAPEASPQPQAPATPATKAGVRPVIVPKTIKLKKPAPVGIKRETVDVTAEPGSKRETSKIPLPVDSSIPTTPMPTGTRTIQIAPSSTPPAVPPSGVTPDPKRQTSRISLESVLGSESEEYPRTIKLRRPAAAPSTIKVQPAEPSASLPPVSGEEPPVAGETDGAGVQTGDDARSETQKKTIKVRRPSMRPTIRTAARTDADTEDTVLFKEPAKAKPAADTAHWTFITTAFAAVFVCCILIYALTAQVIGPNISLTGLSYGAYDTRLEWFGRIQ